VFPPAPSVQGVERVDASFPLTSRPLPANVLYGCTPHDPETALRRDHAKSDFLSINASPTTDGAMKFWGKLRIIKTASSSLGIGFLCTWNLCLAGTDVFIGGYWEQDASKTQGSFGVRPTLQNYQNHVFDDAGQPYPETDGFLGIDFISRTEGWLVGRNDNERPTANAYRTTDSGDSWSLRATGIDANDNLQSVSFFDSSNGFIASTGGSIYTTTDGGANWTDRNLIATGTNDTLRSVQYVTSTIGYAVGQGGSVFKTTDSGVNWSPQTSATSSNLNSVYFMDENTGWAVGSGGTVIMTADGGGNWTLGTSGVSTTLRGVAFNNVGTTGILVGSSGFVAQSTDSGSTWSQISVAGLGTTVLRDVTFNSVDNAKAWFVGDGGVVYKSTDSGSSWSSETSVYSGFDLRAVDVQNVQNMQAVSESSTYAPVIGAVALALFHTAIQKSRRRRRMVRSEEPGSSCDLMPR
jgi:photosystem II stability/assembly factor-like uncharacterized protein